MLKSINDQTPATKNQITNSKPDIIKNSNDLMGYFANSINGGFIKPITYKYVMAGEKHLEYRMRMNIRMLTPLTPAYQKLKATFRTYFVPNKRVWDNAEKFISQKGGSTETKIKTIPNLGGKPTPTITLHDNTTNIPLFDTDLWRDSWENCYMPKYMTGLEIDKGTTMQALPEYSVLPFRGFKAIYNDFERNKEYDPEWTEYKGDTVTDTEYRSLFEMTNLTTVNRYIVRGKRQNSYYTDYRTELLGEETTEPTPTNGQLIDFTEWEKTVAELRSQAENSQLNDWDIIAKIRGSKKLTEGKVQLLSTKTVGLNYQAITQSTYNTNANIKEEFQTMGQQGAYSYTEVDIPLYQMQEFNEEGYIHVIMQVSADTIFETGFERTGLNINYDDIYRPDLKDLKHDVLYRIEKDGSRSIVNNLKSVDGFKRKFSEYFKLPQPIGGDMTTGGAYQTASDGTNNFIMTEAKTRIEPQRTFQFFEIDDRFSNEYVPKKIWKDYTDLQINKNQAIRQEELRINSNKTNEDYEILIKGQNQIFFIGLAECITNLPIDENIRKNYTTWGEK